jgi:hypothetical protein
MSYHWNTGSYARSDTVDEVGIYWVAVTNSFTCSDTAYLPVATELVTDGSFTNYNPSAPSFYSEYERHQSYYNPAAANPDTTGLWPEGRYAVNIQAWYDNPLSLYGYHPLFHGKDHTNNASGAKNFMMVNGSTSLIGSPPHQRVIWQQTVAVEPNTDYYFSAWGMNLNPGNPAQLRFEVNGVQVGTIADLNLVPGPETENDVNPGNWMRFYSNPYWNSGTATTAVIRIINLNLIAGGNDFGLDDISFGTLDPPRIYVDPVANGGNDLCEGDTLYLLGNVEGGVPPFTFSWTGPNGFTSSIQNPFIPDVVMANAGWYYLTVGDASGCPTDVQDSTYLGVLDAPLSQIFGNNTVCPNLPWNLYTGPPGMSTYNWHITGNGAIIGSTVNDSVTVTTGSQCDSTFTITLTITNASGCDSTCSKIVMVDDNIKPVITTLASSGNLGCNPVVTPPAFNGTDNCQGTITPVVTTPGPVITGCTYNQTWTANYTDGCGNEALPVSISYSWTVDAVVPEVSSCPVNLITVADAGFPYATVSLPSPVYSDNCTALGDIAVTWTMSIPTAGTGTGIIPVPFQFNIGTTTVTYKFTDACGNFSTCIFTVTVDPNYPPDISCPGNITQNTDPGECSATLDPGYPTLLSGTPPVIISWVMTGATTGSGTGPVLPNPYTFNEGLTTITWTASNAAGIDTCYQLINIIDNEQPAFETPAPFVFCVNAIFNATYDGEPEPLADIVPDRPDWYTVDGTPDLDLVNITDNCCSEDEMEIQWTIVFSNGYPSISGTGQPSAYGPITLWGTTDFTVVVHTITYLLVDCNGNSYGPVTVNITIKPRPNVTKM